jgi:hypothetical protein
MSRIARSPALVVGGWAIVGLLFGHMAAYDLVYPDGHVHAQVLASTGHGWLSIVEPSIIVALLIAVVAGLVGSRAGTRRVARFRVLAFIQVGAFLGMELLERLGHGLTAADIGHELVDHGLWLVLLVGVLAQLVTAWLGSAVSRTVAASATSCRRRPHHRIARPAILPSLAPHPHVAGTPRAIAIRGPPARVPSRG